MLVLKKYAPLIVFTLGLTACGDGPSVLSPSPGEENGGSRNTNTGNTDRPTDTAVDPGPMDREPRRGGNYLGNFPLDQLTSLDVPKDGIPALTDPPSVAPGAPAAAYLHENDRVLGVVINGEARAYPHNIGWHNEIINDVVGGRPIVVTFCPLTGTGLVFDGAGSEGRRIALGVSGLLFNNNLIMYDRRDSTPETLYPQMTHIGIAGPRQGLDLNLLPVTETTWRYWKQLYPGTSVIGENTGTPRNYSIYPFGDYRFPNAPPLLPVIPPLSNNPIGDLFAAKDLVLGLRFFDLAKAYPFKSMGEEAVINDILDGSPVLIVWYSREQMAIPYDRRQGAAALTFGKIPSNDPAYPFLLQDRETGSTWNLKGQAIAGPYTGRQLQQLPAHNAFWFAWASFWQNSGIY